MITTFDIVDTLYPLLSSDTGLKSSISGDIYKKRPVNSSLEDIEIGSLPINNEQIQQAIANVNIYVPNLTVKINNVQDNTQPNTKRLKELAYLVCNILDEQYHGNYWFSVQQQNVFEGEGEHYVNIRVNFNYLN